MITVNFLVFAIIFTTLSFAFASEGNATLWASAVNETVTAQGANFQWWIENTEGKFGVAKSNKDNHNLMTFGMNRNAANLMPKREGLFCAMTFVANKKRALGNEAPNAMCADNHGICANVNGNAEEQQIAIRLQNVTIPVKVLARGIEEVPAGAESSKVKHNLLKRRIPKSASGIYINAG